MMLAKSLPQVRILAAEVRPMNKKMVQKTGKLAGNLFDLCCVVNNESFLPSALEMADRVKIVRLDRVAIKLPDGAELEKSFNSKIEIGRLKSGDKKEIRWRFKIKVAPSEVNVSEFSVYGGVDKRKVSIAD